MEPRAVLAYLSHGNDETSDNENRQDSRVFACGITLMIQIQ
jgi:hypothetical protein